MAGSSSRASSIGELKQYLLKDVTKITGGNGDIYADPEYSLVILENRQEIHFSVGRSRVDISHVE